MGKSFIEVQFPVSKISKETYKERKAGSNQILTGLGKWWGRKPLILVRSTLLGLLLPSTDNPKKDKEIFLKILKMDRKSLLFRKNKPLSIEDIYENLPEVEVARYFLLSGEKPEWKAEVSQFVKRQLQEQAFSNMSYDSQLTYCLRPEEVSFEDATNWKEINEYLGTNVSNLRELIIELGTNIYNRVPIVGDCFSGGGSIPYESGKLGCSIYASDLNPLAGLLTWADLNILSLSDEEISKAKEFQNRVYDSVAEKIDALGIENNEMGWKAKYYLYCTEVTCPECGVVVPLAPNWIISEKYKSIALLKLDEDSNSYDIDILTDATQAQLRQASLSGTVKDNYFVCPKCKVSTPIAVLRREGTNHQDNIQSGLRKWKKEDYFPRETDVFRERLYCIKYIEKHPNKTWDQLMKKPGPATDSTFGNVYYVKPTEKDLLREQKVIDTLADKMELWQQLGFLPDSEIETGEKTKEPIRNRGWSYWHQLLNHRQLLMIGLLAETVDEIADSKIEYVLGILGINKCADWNSKLSIWNTGRDVVQATFTNQALNTLYNYAARGMASLYTTWLFQYENSLSKSHHTIEVVDARSINKNADLWITDPPYADAINYHELSEFFLAFDKKLIRKAFPEWYTDSKRALAVKGRGVDFNKSMIEIYKNLTNHMPDNGMQVVMFTHQDPSVWADLTLILWSAGLQVTAAWNIATETESGGLKSGNYVKGTVLLVLRKQKSESTAFLDEIYPKVEQEVKNQIDSMRELDDKEDPNFSDPDYLLAAFAASLKVLTSYKNIEDIDVEYELSKTKDPKNPSAIEKVINDAVKIAYDYLLPQGFDSFIWRSFSPEERFYIKGLELEKNNIYQIGAYQELARSFGVREYKELLLSTRANQVKLKSAMDFANKNMNSTSEFSKTILRDVLMAIHLSVKNENVQKGKDWIKNEIADYWSKRTLIIAILEYIGSLHVHTNLSRWEIQSKYSKYLAEAIRSDSV